MTERGSLPSRIYRHRLYICVLSEWNLNWIYHTHSRTTYPWISENYLGRWDVSLVSMLGYVQRLHFRDEFNYLVIIP